MRTIQAIPAGAVDLSGIGRLFDLSTGTDRRVVSTTGTDWWDNYTAEPVVSGPTHVGLTTGPQAHEQVIRMERHLHTREALLPLTEPVVLPVSRPNGSAPQADHVQALIVAPGQCLMLEAGVWHAPAMGIDAACAYFWLAGVNEAIEPDWEDIRGGPLSIRVLEQADHE